MENYADWFLFAFLLLVVEGLPRIGELFSKPAPSPARRWKQERQEAIAAEDAEAEAAYYDDYTPYLGNREAAELMKGPGDDAPTLADVAGGLGEYIYTPEGPRPPQNEKEWEEAPVPGRSGRRGA